MKNRKKKPDPEQAPSRKRDEAYFKVLTEWLEANNGSFNGMGSEQIKWYRANYPKYAPTQSATGNQTVTVEPWKPTGGKHPEIDKGYEREQRKIAKYLRSDFYRNSLPFDKEDIDYKRKHLGKEAKNKTDQEIDSLIRNDFVENRLKTLYDTFDLRLSSPEDANDGANAYWDPENNVMSFDDLNPRIGTFQEELLHRSGADEMYTKDTIPGINPASLALKDFNLTGRNLDTFTKREAENKPLPKDGPLYRGYMADNRERRAKQYVTRQALGNYGYDPNSIIPKGAIDSIGLGKHFFDIPSNAAQYYEYYYDNDNSDINKYNKGGIIKNKTGETQSQEMKKLNKRKTYNVGGVVDPTQGVVDSLAGVSGMFGPVGQGVGAALQLSKALLTNPSNYQPVRQNTTSGYNMGGMVPPQGMGQNSIAQMVGDTQLNSQAMEVQGSPGVDTNQRQVAGQNVNLTQGETVQATGDGAFVFSDSPDMKDPLTGKTFAQAAKKYQKAIGAAEKALQRSPSDKMAKKTIEESNKQLEKIAERQQMMNNNNQGEQQPQQPTEGGNFYAGGIIPANSLRASNPYGVWAENQRNISSTIPAWMSGDPNFVGSNNLVPNFNPTTANSLTPPTIGAARAANKIPVNLLSNSVSQRQVTSQTPAPDPLLGAKNRGGLTLANTRTKKDKGFGNTLGDKINLGTMAAETLGRAVQAFQPVENVRNDKYALDRQIYNPAAALDRNTRNFQANQQAINTGNANTDRVLRANSYATRLNTDRDTISQYDTMQRQSDQQINTANESSRYQVDVNNTQNEGARNTAISKMLTQVGALGAEAQDYSNARYDNNITLATLNSLSTHYGIDVKSLQDLAKNDPQAIERMIMFKGTV